MKNDSLGSMAVSPAMFTVIVFVISPAEKLTTPDGSVPPAKSAPLTKVEATVIVVTAQLALTVVAGSPVRVTVKVTGLAPALPSVMTAFGLPSVSVVTPSSLRMTPLAKPVPIAAPAEALLRVKKNSSVASLVASARMGMEMTLVVSPAAKLTVPLGSTPPGKSAAAARFMERPVVTTQFAEAAMLVSPDRVTVKLTPPLLTVPS